MFRDENISGNIWTLVIEARFYVLVGLQFYLLSNRYVMIVPAIVMIMNVDYLLAFGRGSVLLSYLPVFYVGIGIYRAEAAGWSRATLIPLAVFTVVAGASLPLFLVYGRFTSAVYLALQALLFVWVLRAGWYVSWLGFFGRISYSLYLYHFALGIEVFSYLRAGATPAVLQVLIVFAVTTLVAYLSFIWIEEPGVQFGKRVERRWRDGRL